MAFFTSLFRNLKDGGAVYPKPSWAHQMIINNPGGVYKKEGGAVRSTRLVPKEPGAVPGVKHQSGSRAGKKLFNLTPEMVNTMYGKPLAKKNGGSIKTIFGNIDQEMFKSLTTPLPRPIRKKDGGRLVKPSPFLKGGKVKKNKKQKK